MGKSKSKSKGSFPSSATKWESLPWSKVQVNKDTDADIDDNDELDDSKYLKAANHYDNPKAKSSDLYDVTSSKGIDYLAGANDPGIFLGLEVIDGSQYSVEKIPIRNEVTKQNTGGFVTKLIIKDAVAQSMKEEVQLQQAEREKISLIKAKDQALLNDDTKILTRKQKNRLKLDKIKEKRIAMQLEKKRKRQETGNSINTDHNEQKHEDNSQKETKVSAADGVPVPAEPKDAQKKKNAKKKQKNKTHKRRDEPNSDLVTKEQMDNIRVSWSVATGGVYLHPNICASLYRLGFTGPTPIQSSTLAASILGQRDVVGAAPTGSGKTLSYLLPILHALLTEEDEQKDTPITQYPLTALILCPTRELAMQVSTEFSKLVNAVSDIPSKSLIQCGTIVGGLSEQKQKRVLDTKRPPVLVGTPGRLWDLMSSGKHEHLENLKQLRFLVIDEADRMISQGNFPQLEGVFEKIQQANPSLEYMEAHAEEEYESDSDDEDRLQSLPGIRGEAKVHMLDDELLKMIERQNEKDKDTSMQSDEESNAGRQDRSPEPLEIDDEEYEAQQQAMLLENIDEGNSSDEDNSDTTEAVKRQTFIFSATLTLPTSSHQTIDSQFQAKKGKKRWGKLSIDGAIAEILEKVGAQGQTKVVDLSTSGVPQPTKEKKKRIPNEVVTEPSTKPTVRLPPGLSLYEIKCTQKHKDSHLYSFLASTKQGSSGPCLIFCNSIGGVKRVGETLKILGLPARMLHAQMQQKARLSALESLSKSNSRSIVVATDVAARGLDIPSVASVVHYDVARAVDTFVHRAGRTARGIGEKAVGWSVSLVAAPEERNHQSICRAVKGDSNSFDTAAIDSRLLKSAQERVNFASKIFVCENNESRTKKSNQWFIDAANDAGLELDQDLLDDGQLGGSKKDRQQYLDAKRARQELKMLLAKPMRKRAFGKFLSNAGLRDAIKTEQEIKPYIVPDTGLSKKKRKKQNTL